MSLPACHREAGSDGRKAVLRLAQFEGLRDAARAPAPARPRQAPVSAADDGRWGWGGRAGGGKGGCETRSSRSPFSGPSFCKTPAQLAPWLPLLERRGGTRPCGEGTGQTSPAGVMGAPATAMGPGIADLTRARASDTAAREGSVSGMSTRWMKGRRQKWGRQRRASVSLRSGELAEA